MSKQKYYVVWKGVIPGIYTDWDEAKAQVSNFIGAKYKSFTTITEAELAFKSKPEDFIGKPENKASEVSRSQFIKEEKINPYSICVDAACSGNPGDMEYRGVDTVTGKELFKMGPFPMGTNNVGEFLAIVHGASLLKKLEKPNVIIYTDSRTAISWVKLKNPKTKLDRTEENKPIFELLERATLWLKSNTILNPIVHWQTEQWGEIPADFGRK